MSCTSSSDLKSEEDLVPLKTTTRSKTKKFHVLAYLIVVITSTFLLKNIFPRIVRIFKSLFYVKTNTLWSIATKFARKFSRDHRWRSLLCKKWNEIGMRWCNFHEVNLILHENKIKNLQHLEFAERTLKCEWWKVKVLILKTTRNFSESQNTMWFNFNERIKKGNN